MLFGEIAELHGHPARGARVVVIGSGVVGLYTAVELARRGCQVVVVESGSTGLGGFGPESFVCVGRPHDGIRIGRSRTLGGTSNLWGGQLVEFQPVDFRGRDWMPGSRWPISYEEVAPYYPLTYENLGIDRAAQDDDLVWKAVDGGRPRLGEGLELFLTRWLRTPGFAAYYAREIARCKDLLVLTGHTAVGFAGRGGHIAAVKVKDRSGGTHALTGDTFIVAAGTIETVRLLLHSAADTAWECPWRDNHHVGARFQDHLGGRIAYVQPEDRKAFFNTFCTIVSAGHKYQPKIRLTNEVLERDRILNIQGMVTFESSVSENLVYLKQFVKAALYSRRIGGIPDLFRNMRACSRYLIPLMWRYAVDHRIFVPNSSRVSLIVQAEQRPCADSRVAIDPGWCDANGLPRVVLDWRVSGEELDPLHDFALRADRALRGAGLGRLDIDPALRARDPRFLSTLRDTNHQAGGAVMGFTERDGVVDRDLKVFGAENLYVGGAATFRTVSNANTTFTALALATRLVHHLAGVDAADRLPAAR